MNVNFVELLRVIRLVMCGALVGVALGNLLGIDFVWIAHTDYVTGALGATSAGILLKLSHVF